MEGIDEAPHDIENPKDPLQEELDKFSPLSRSRCIYRVPERLRQRNEKAYTPQVVSIGPLHHGKERLKAMEEQKKRYLRHFLSRNRVSFYDYIKKIKDQEERLRGSYAESIEFSSDQFVRIVSVDAAFVIDLLARYHHPDYGADDEDYIFSNPGMMTDVDLDLMLLENQLPFFILQDVLTLFSSLPLPSLLQLSYVYFEGEIVSEGKEEKCDNILSSGVQVQHFVDLIRILYLPLKSTETTTEPIPRTTATPNVTKLHQAGVEFEVGKGRCLLDMEFSGGILKIPKLTVSDRTDLTLRNLLAFEQCHHREEDHLANYVLIMNRLAKTSKDVELLVEKGIIINWLGDTQKISTLLHDLGTGIMISHSYHATLCEDLITYSTKPWRKWKANLKQYYFNTPWSTISVAAAVILLILTVVQTACSIKSVP